MKFSEIRKLANEYNSCNDFNRRNQLFCEIESYAEKVFKKLCKYKKNFLRDLGLIDDECWLSNFNKPLKTHWGSPLEIGFLDDNPIDGLMVSFCKMNGDDGHLVIPSKYFDYSEEDWNNELK